MHIEYNMQIHLTFRAGGIIENTSHFTGENTNALRMESELLEVTQ